MRGVKRDGKAEFFSRIVFILGLLAMLMPLSIDMYLPALPVIAAQFNCRTAARR